MQERINCKRNKYFLGVFNLFICLFVMGTFIFNKHFSVDDYWIYYNQDVASRTDIGQNMRPVSGTAYWLLNIIGVSCVEEQIFFGILLIFVFAWVITMISLEIIEIMNINNEIRKVILVNGGTLTLFLNASLSEYLYYSGVYLQWTIAALGMAYAAIYIGKEEKVLKNWIVGLAALIVVAGSYQTFMSQYAYVVMALIFIRNNGKINRKSVLAVLRAMLAAITAIAVNILCVKILTYTKFAMGISRMSIKLSEAQKLIGDILQAQKSIWIEGMGIYPQCMLGIALALVLGMLIIVMYKSKTDCGAAIYMVIVLVSGQCVMYMAQIMQGYIRVTNRSMMPIYGIYTVIIWSICYYLGNIAVKKTLQNITIIGIIIFIIISRVKIDEVAVDTFKTNTVSRCYIEEINKRICSYEKQNGIEITKVGFCSDENISYRYYRFIDTSAYGDMCANPFLASWSSVNSLNYYSGRNFVSIDVPESIAAYYSSRNWDEADWDEQLAFDNDAVYICVF